MQRFVERGVEIVVAGLAASRWRADNDNDFALRRCVGVARGKLCQAPGDAFFV